MVTVFPFTAIDPGTSTLPMPLIFANRAKESLPVPYTTVTGFRGSLIVNTTVVFTDTPDVLFGGDTAVTDGIVVSGVADAQVVKLELKGSIVLPAASFNPAIWTL